MADVARVGAAWIVHADCQVAATGQLADPDTLTLTWTDPSGNVATYTYGGGEVTRASKGKFYKQFTFDEAGIWTWTWTGTGAVTAVTDGSIQVLGND